MRSFMIVFGLMLLGAVSANAQEDRGVEVSGHYQYVRFNPGSGASGINCQGGSGSFGAYLTSRAGIVGGVRGMQSYGPAVRRECA